MEKIKFVVVIFLIAVNLTGNAQSKNAELIYVMDPQCSWCYANSGNIEEIAKELKGTINVDFKVAGMWLGDDAPQGGVAFLNRVTQHLPGMISKTGANVGTAYYDLASDTSHSFNSLEPAAAIVLVRKMNPDKTLVFAKNVEHALFEAGKSLNSLETYLEILKQLNIDTGTFKENWMSEDNISNTKVDFKQSKKLVNTFPTLLLKRGAKSQILGVGYFTKEEILPKLKTALAQ